MTCAVACSLAGLALALVTLGCDGQRWVVAEGAAPGVSRTGPSFGCSGADDLLAARGRSFGVSQVSERHVGRWRGRLSGTAVGSFPAEEVELVLNAEHTGTLLFLGAGPPAPESALEGYLCDGDASGTICGTPSGFVGGFAYELLGIGTRGAVISFVVVDADPWRPWCELQAPIESVDLAAACGHTFSVGPVAARRWSETGCTELLADGTERGIDCALMSAIERCWCGHDRCVSSFETSIEVGMSLSDDGEELRGSLWFKDNLDAALLTLRRQP